MQMDQSSNQHQWAPQPQVAPWPGPYQAMPMSQQSSTTNNIVITTQPGAVSGPPIKRDWSSGLCDCCSDFSTCCLAWCCPLCLQCMIAQDMGDGCCGACCYCWCNPASLLGLRTYMRGKENIRGSLCDDFNLTVGCLNCCYCCVLAQLAREVKHVKSVKGYI